MTIIEGQYTIFDVLRTVQNPDYVADDCSEHIIYIKNLPPEKGGPIAVLARRTENDKFEIVCASYLYSKEERRIPRVNLIEKLPQTN